MCPMTPLLRARIFCRGRSTRVPLSRRWVTDFLYFARKVPSIPVVRLMNLKPLVDARNRLERKVSWVAIFSKAFALTAVDFPEFRRAYLGSWWPWLYEHPISVASIAVERNFESGKAVFFGRV